MFTPSDEAAEQAAANRSALAHHQSFQSHRERLTARVRAAATRSAPQSLCVLGAGNVYDLDLRELGSCLGEIHLVDLDAAALDAARARQDEAIRERIVCHAPLELSGMHDRLERWARMQLTPQELIDHAGVTSRRIREAVGQTFDLVLSACVLSQMQLSLLRALGERHRLFEALRMTLNLTHLRTLLELAAPGGRGLFVSDVSSDTIARFDTIEPGAAALELVNRLADAGDVFAFAEPRALRNLFLDDPWLSHAGKISELEDAWLWRNGDAQRFLVYALELTRAC